MQALGLALGAACTLSAHGQAASAPEAPASAAPAAVASHKVRLATSMGDIVVELYRDKAPKTVDNFVQYVKAGHYDGTIFHRVISNFMIQGGGMKPDMSEKPTRAPIPLESRNGLSNVKGSIAMARTMVPNSATSQFFINVNDNTFLDQPNARDGEGYAVFGKVIAGLDVVEKIKDVETKPKGPHQNVPAQPITIKKATLE
ncbi:peptidylprolyl isomerase [Ideonella lacteola]|uniref:peptidylprolyl isomerase n=1 Tax=Ideonella lacteola TaxID=2984193 RepID=UPI003BF9E40C